MISKNSIKIVNLKKFKDFRGYYIETFNEKKYFSKYGIKFVQDDFSSSKKNILRGFHGDDGTWKIFSCIYGQVQFAFINYNKKSKNYKKNISIVLSEKDSKQIIVPPKFGTAHLVISDKAIIHYKQSSYYKEFKQFTINYKSSVFRFKWKSKKIITSSRDKGGLLID